MRSSWPTTNTLTLWPGDAQFLLLHGLEKLGKRRFGQKSVELRAVIIDQTDVFDNHIDDLPISIRVLETVTQQKLLSFVVDKFGVDLGKVLILPLVQKAYLFPVVGLDVLKVRVFEETGEELHKLLLLFRAALLPLGTQRTFSHFVKIEPGIDNFFDLLSSLLGVARSFKCRVV